ncbi:zinc-alpha-2-glycoprotein-like isoform X1 [Carassius carassius]|uniref:zinc-alpha-2-glycoprotein-like isoform X1 n=1 Tax=Carassius carassius TaxID=217509 RepID=UPI002868E2E2|nr:zinc-alpha-2-glycoprotein-like isoform X1 [Carassius carassius]
MAKWFTRALLFIGIITVWLTSDTCLSYAHQDKLEKHYLHYMFTVLTKADLFPEFTVVGVVDDRLISDYSIEVPDWTRLILMEDYGVMTLVQSCDSADWFMDQVHILSNCTNCSELHTLQRIVGCEVEKFPNGTVKSLNVFDEYGFDGEDLIAFENDTMQWIVKSPKAKEMKKKWDLQIGRNQFIKDYFGKCMDWILTFNNTYNNSPEVYISARRDPDDHTKLNLSCLATGFYPRDIEMNIRLKESVLDNQTSSEIRPNANETFQMRTSVKIDKNSEGSYDCFIIHSSLTEPASVEWDGKCSTFETDSDQTLIIILSVSVVAVVFVMICSVVIFYQCKNESNESFPPLRRSRHPDYGSVKEQISMRTAASAGSSEEELTVDESAN